MTGAPLSKTVWSGPAIVDYGSISDHTFTRSSGGGCGQNDPPKDWRPCKLDKFCEWSCPS